ncbi:FKBP-type peptidyl-prolyl cis-trans isomerase [Oceanisphaera pacifica]|uniref:Peptidyl-prolyl cis-trans isomerase n=1 Tax=Oceanisphaera pacifica TaxID=2818389 RepID=A0ABS3NJG9_9GAMM|nr:FKBP-type peptidyl-prolyl cis-trans isomerase [Oceanisphaera pacifica]MBO1520660.1 FKBP-type peptidyl-prolyl cis-trans isomerase [Oceanisphaera pacifica]
MSSYETVELKASYGVGRQIGDQLTQQSFEGLDVTAVQQGLADAIAGVDFAVSREDINSAFQVITQRMQEKQAAESAKAKEAEAEFLGTNGARAEVEQTESGLQYEVLVKGEGATPSETDTVSVHYHGTFIDGSVFDSSVMRGEPAQFPVNGVIKGWVEALQLMPVGSKWKLYVPYELAYGEQGAGAIPPCATLVFEVELLEIA